MPDGRATSFETARGTGPRSVDTTCALPRDAERRLGSEAFVIHDDAADPFQYRDLAGAVDRPVLDAGLRARDAAFPWSHPEDDPP